MVVGGTELAAILALDEGRSPSARVVARASALDLHHIGAKISENLPRPRAGQNARKLKDANAGEWPGHGVTPIRGMSSPADLVPLPAARGEGQRTYGLSHTVSKSCPIRWLGVMPQPWMRELITMMRCHHSSGTV